ncbi:MAG: cysteine desulfurase [Chthoniobacterales bacterium]|nr:cysteine desulfurase [Chthoniobacterales bacterium]
MIYLDNNATTPPDPLVREAMLPYLGEKFGNPSSPHAFGRAAKAAVERARGQVGFLLGAPPDAVVFTGGGTESINTAVRGALAAQPGKRHIVTTAIEHSATKVLCEQLAREGCEVTWLAVDQAGQPDQTDYLKSLRPDTAIVTVVWANNETGVLLPIEAMARAADERRVVFHADAVQAVGKIPVDLRKVPVHLLSAAAHKFHGPKGTGVLFVRPGLGLPPLILGGDQERGRRSGTENVAGIVGMGAAAELAGAALETGMPRVAAMRDAFEAGVRERFAGVRFHGDQGPRLPNTSNFALPGLPSRDLLAVLDHLGVACSIGSACSSGAPDASHVLRAMGVLEEEAKSSLRFSFSRMNTPADAGGALSALSEAIRRMASGAPGD